MQQHKQKLYFNTEQMTEQNFMPEKNARKAGLVSNKLWNECDKRIVAVEALLSCYRMFT